MANLEDVYRRFMTLYGSTPLLVKAPGRVNLIGEHTDYNQGLVLPAAVTLHVFMAVQAREDDRIELFAEDIGETYTTRLVDLKPSGIHWPDYILGVADQIQKGGRQLQGFNLVFGGNIPMGAGLSSSAAVESATVFALNRLFGLDYTSMELARLAQRAENEFVGLNCGLMDPFASVFGRAENLVQLDCESLEYAYIPFDAPELRIVLFDTQVKHSLASSAYNRRREECEEGVRLIAAHHPDVRSLRHATLAQLERFVRPVDETLFRRCAYVVQEISRLQEGVEDLRRGDLPAFGQKMYATHRGLKHDYEVSCPELDFLVDAVERQESVLGARMMGGGFGGCTINLVRAEAVDALRAQLELAYEARFGRGLKTYVAEIGDGVSECTLTTVF